MARFICFSCLWLFARSILAQDSTIGFQRPPRLILKLAPLALLLDPDATIQGGLEVRTGRRSSIQAEAGFGHKGLAIIANQKKDFADWSIWRVRAEWRHYTNRYRTNKRQAIRIRSDFPLGNYVAIEGFGKQIEGTKNLFVYDNGAGVPNGQQTIRRFVLGSHVKWGRQIAIPGSTVTSLSRVLLDFYVGIGLRYGDTQLTPDDNSSPGGFLYDRFRAGHRIQPSVSAGLKIGLGL